MWSCLSWTAKSIIERSDKHAGEERQLCKLIILTYICPDKWQLKKPASLAVVPQLPAAEKTGGSTPHHAPFDHTSAHYNKSKMVRRWTSIRVENTFIKVSSLMWNSPRNHEQQYLSELHHFNSTTMRHTIPTQRLKARLNTSIMANFLNADKW